jgi:hypothetical protein
MTLLLLFYKYFGCDLRRITKAGWVPKSIARKDLKNTLRWLNRRNEGFVSRNFP